MSKSDIESVSTFLRSVQSGDFDGALNQLSDDVVLEEMGSIPHSGTFKGRDGAGELFERFGELYGGVALDDVSVHDAGEFIVARMTGTFTSKNGARKAVMPVTEHYTMRDGKIAHADIYYKDPNQLNAFDFD